MRRPQSKELQLSFADVTTFLAVARHGSITAASRELDATPSQVSKAVHRLQSVLRMDLIARQGRGLVLTDDGRRAAGEFEEVNSRLLWLKNGKENTAPLLTVGGPSYLNFHVLPVLARGLEGFRLRGIELPPSLLRAYSAENFFDVALTAGEGRFPSSWVSVYAGDLRRGLFASPRVAKTLGRKPVPASALKALPFVMPVFYSNGQPVAVDDGCPLGKEDRRAGHEVSMIGLGLEMARQTDQLVFGPTLSARPYIQRGELVEIVVDGWDVRDRLYVSCNMDRVLARVQAKIVTVVGASLE